MRLAIEHRTTLRFEAPQPRLVRLLRLTPADTHDQTVARWQIDIDRDARMRRHRDGFGNVTTMLYCDGPMEALEIAVSGCVVTSHSDGVLHGTHEPLPPAMFLRSTPTTTADAALAAFARDAGGRDGLDRLHRLNAALHARFSPDREGSGLATAPEAFVQNAATPAELAQMFVAAARSTGVPSRYVSGYALGGDQPQARPHGWADAWVEGIGWIGFDPSTGACPEERHVRVAVALDAAGAAPLAAPQAGAVTMEVALTASSES